jgi:catechol 2,3-dioxygenase-like lactoylglutathione lyase family enzyme
MMNWLAKKIRFARPTDQWDAVIAFYETGLGLPIIGRFEEHAGYDGVIFGMPDETVQLEITRHIHGSPCPAPTQDNLLVLYFNTHHDFQEIVERLQTMGYLAVEPENPYWLDKSITIADPDGWRVVLCDLSMM